MMKRMTLCITILIVIIVSAVGSLYFMNRSNREVFERIDEIVELYNAESPEVEEKIHQLDQYWDEYYVRFSYVTQSSALDDISYSVAKLKALYEEGSDEFVSECESIKYWVKRIYDRQFPYFYSIF